MGGGDPLHTQPRVSQHVGLELNVAINYPNAAHNVYLTIALTNIIN